MIKRLVAATATASLFSIAGCGAGGGGIAVSSVNPTSPSYSSLQFAVGTANLYGRTHGALNVVSTFRQTDGDSATGVNTPKISGPLRVEASPVPAFAEADASNSGFPDPYTTLFNGGPGERERFGTEIIGTPQTVAPGTPSCDGPGPFPNPPKGQSFVRCPHGLAPNTSTFGQSGGVFALGLQPANAVAASGQAYSYQPYPQPINYRYEGPGAYTFVPWGGPPAFDPNGTKMGERDGLSFNGVDSFGDPYFLGVGEGVTVFDGVRAGNGVYELSVAIATVGSGGAVTTSTVRKTAHLDASHVLPTIQAPAFTFDGKGGGTFEASLPPGVREMEVQIVDWGPSGGPNDGGAATPQNCQKARGTAFAPVYYTIVVRQAAKTTYRLPDTIGPNLATSGGLSNLKPSPSICTAAQNAAVVGKNTPGDDIVVQSIGFDYPMYEAALGLTQATTPEDPKIADASGQADITVARAMEQDNNQAAQTPLMRAVRHAAVHYPVRR